jgi:hypothetical protein
MAIPIPIPIPDTHPNVDWEIKSTDEIQFVFSEGVDHFEVDYPDYFEPKVKPGPHPKGHGSKHKPNTKHKRVHFKYLPDNTDSAESHTILIGN